MTVAPCLVRLLLTVQLLVVGRASTHAAPSHLASPMANDTRFLLIASTRRSASSEAAEQIGNHPCAASFNELVEHAHFQPGYSKYKANLDPGKGGTSVFDQEHTPNAGYEEYTGFHSLSKAPPNMLANALAARQKFCDARPQVVLDVCGSVCVIALKIHMDVSHCQGKKVTECTGPDVLNLITYQHAKTVFLERSRLANFCSLQWALFSNDYGATPDTHATKYTSRPPCNTGEEANAIFNGYKNVGLWLTFEKFVKKVDMGFGRSRDALRKRGQAALEVTFADYVKDPAAEAERMLTFAGLVTPVGEWLDVCPYAWCVEMKWPTSR